jgi:hypothetical protein
MAGYSLGEKASEGRCTPQDLRHVSITLYSFCWKAWEPEGPSKPPQRRGVHTPPPKNVKPKSISETCLTNIIHIYCRKDMDILDGIMDNTMSQYPF